MVSKTLIASFDTRREAEMTVERLVQEQGINRADIFIVAAGNENTAGEERAGSDNKAGDPSPEARDDSALNGRIMVSVEVNDDALADVVIAAFSEFDAADVTSE